MIKINYVDAPLKIKVGEEFPLDIDYTASTSYRAEISVEPAGELVISPPSVALDPAPGGGKTTARPTIRRTAAGGATLEARIIVKAGTSSSTFTRLT